MPERVARVNNKIFVATYWPHVENLANLGHFVIQKEESSSSGVRRIKAILEPLDNNNK